MTESEKGLTKTRFGVLISGGGTNLQAIIDAIEAGSLPAEVAVVISSRPDAYGLVRAANASIPAVALSGADYRDAEAADELIVSELNRARVDYVVLAGYMRKVLSPLLDAFPDRIINLHPALLPSFPGAHGIEDAWNYGVKVTGVTVHFANEEYDTGPIIAQRAVPINEDDTIETLTDRIHKIEHELLPYVLTLIAEQRITLGEDRRVNIR
jgi:phosphoribosylglycinamide formyltransferase-1